MAIIDNLGGGMGASEKEQLQAIYDRVVNNKHIYKVLKSEVRYADCVNKYTLDIKNYISNYSELDLTDFRIILTRLSHTASGNTGNSYDYSTGCTYDPLTGILTSDFPLAYKSSGNVAYSYFDVCVITQKNVEFI